VRRILIIAFLLGLFAVVADARPGGGHSSSGGGRSSSSSRSSGGGGGFRSSGGGGGSMSPEAMVVILVVVVVILAVQAAVKAKQRSSDNWSSGSVAYSPPVTQPQRVNLEKLRRVDPDFSAAVFEDFVFELFAAAHRGRSDPKRLDALGAYLSPTATQYLRERGAMAPAQIVIGSLKVNRKQTLEGPPRTTVLFVRIEATLHLARPLQIIEEWAFAREEGTVSKPPTRNRTWPCPNCGAPWTANATRTCGNCQQPMGMGRFDWVVSGINQISMEPALASLTGTVEEYGNDLPTVRATDVDEAMAGMTTDDPAITFAAIQARTQLVYHRLNEAWNTRDLRRVRGLVTASLRNYLQYWLDEYARQGLMNQLTEAQVDRMDLAKLVRDKHYDAITLRVFARGHEFTLDAKGGVVGGSKRGMRAYTEYWTLLRSSARRGPVVLEPKCANCGAPLEQVSDQGDCGHCGATIELGSFDWVLSKIEQDDWYVG
jgi:hypothetical protein